MWGDVGAALHRSTDPGALRDRRRPHGRDGLVHARPRRSVSRHRRTLPVGAIDHRARLAVSTCETGAPQRPGRNHSRSLLRIRMHGGRRPRCRLPRPPCPAMRRAGGMAQRAGRRGPSQALRGFAGKHASVITVTAGSYVLLASVAVSVALPIDAPSQRGCGHCTACLPSCPTGAIVAPGVIDARRCISYLTIEHRGPIPEELRPLMGTWAFGCDLCQEACPINERLAPEPLAVGAPSTAHGPVPHPDLVECLELTDAEFTARFRGTAVSRTGRAGLARNCAIALGNAGDGGALPALRRSAATDPDAVVREAAHWGIAQLTGSRTQAPD